MPTIRFFGAAGQVTGSCFLVSAGHETLLVDCGLFQGGKAVYEQNYAPFGFDPAKLDHVILTHAHADHSGRLPLLVKRGYKGSIHAHVATCDLAEVILLDSAHIQEVEAGWRTRKNRRRGDPKVEPLYVTADAENALTRLRPCRYREKIRLSPRFAFTLRDAGHILGSATVTLEVTKDDGSTVTLLFSGDLGRSGQPIINDPEPPLYADYLVIESTYGARLHKDIAATEEELATILAEAAKSGGNVIIPSFAVGRAQEILYYLRRLKESGRLPSPYQTVYIDSPMAARASAVYDRALAECYDQEALESLTDNGSAFSYPEVRFVSSVEESMGLNMTPGGQLIISAAGMCDAGRILHHLRHNLWNERSHIIFVGYQAEGTKGRKLVDGQPVVKIMREEITVKAKIHTVNALSAHADQEGLVAWASALPSPPKLTMIVHGEPESGQGLKEALETRAGHSCAIAAMGKEIFLER